MGITLYRSISPYTFIMSVLWFSAFAILSLVMRKLRYPIKFTVLPLTILLVLALFKMFVFVRLPGSVIIRSEVFFPAIVNFFRFEIIPPINVLHVIISIWIAVAIILSIRYAGKCVKVYLLVSRLADDRDEKAEAILIDRIGARKDVRVFRTFLAEPIAVAFKPYIYLPRGVEFTDDELRVILRHEWKHLHNKDHLVNLIMEFISFIFWWNPLVNLLKKNISYSRELTCDYFAFAENPEEDRYNLVSAIYRLGSAEETKVVGSRLVGAKDEFVDRIKTWDLYGDKKSHKKRIVANICFFVIAAVMFVVSYMFVIQPAFMESELVHIGIVDDIIAPIECYYSEEVYRADENFIYDNGDGTFSLYIGGQYVMTRDSLDTENHAFIPVRIRGEGSPPR